MKDNIIKNTATGQEIHLAETNNISELKNQYMLLGMNGLAYSPWAKEIQDKIKRLRDTENISEEKK